MDTSEGLGVYIWAKTTHVKGVSPDIFRALRCALAGDLGRFNLGVVLGTGETTGSDHLVRSNFVLELDLDELSVNAASSPVNSGLLADVRGAVNSSTADMERSNCRPTVMPYPPEGTVWVKDIRGEA